MFSIDVQKSIFLKPSLVVGLSKMWYNKTEVATKEELENVKGMIEVSAKIVYSTEVPDKASAVSIPVEYNYVGITSVWFASDVEANSDDPTSTLSQVNITVNKGGDALLPAVIWGQGRPDCKMIRATASASEVRFNASISNTRYAGLTIVAYKYTQ